VVAEAGGTAGLAWDERNRLRRDTAGRDSRVTAGFSALARGRPARRGLRRGGAGGAGVDMASAAAGLHADRPALRDRAWAQPQSGLL